MDNKKFIEFIDENGIEHSMSTILSPSNDFMPCTFKHIGLDGKPKPCTFPVPKNKIDTKNGNNNYCEIHQEVVNKINEARKREAISEYKEEMMKLIQRSINKQEFWKDSHTALIDLKEEIHNFEFHIIQKDAKDGEIIEL